MVIARWAVGVQVIAGVAFLVGAAGLSDDALRALVLLTAAGVLVSRAALGARRAGSVGLLAWAALAALQLLVVVPGLADTDDLPVAAALAGLVALPLAAGLVPAAWMPGLLRGRREDLTPGLLAAALAGGVGVLVAIGLGNVVDVGDGRLETLAPYAAAAGGVLALVELLAHHRVGAGFAPTLLPLAGLALGVQLLVMVDTGDAPVDTAVTALLVGAGVAAVGLFAATALASPRPLVVPVEEAGDGPRLVGWTVAALALVAVVVRLVAPQPLWLDEAATTHVTASNRSDPHPPLFDGLVWLARQVAGASDLALRSPSLIAGVLLIPAIYVTATRLYDRRVGLVAAVVTALGPGVVWLSDRARPGAVAALLATLTVLTLVRAVEDGRLADWAICGLACAALVWAHQFGILHVAVLLAAAAFLLRRSVASTPTPAADDAGSTAVLAPPSTDAATAAVEWQGWGLAVGISVVAVIGVLVQRGGWGPPDLVPPLEYATAGAPGAGRSVLGLAGTAVTAVVGFHPEDVTSRLLALWPLTLLATFVLFCRTWSARGVMLISLAAAPFVALLVLQVAGAPRNPPFALEWVATAVPMLAIGLGRAVTLLGPWPRVRLAGAVVAGVLAVALLDQATRVEPLERFDVTSVVEEAADRAGRDDVIVYAPDELGDLVDHEAPDVDTMPVADATPERLESARQVVIVGAFAFAPKDKALDPTLRLVKDLSSQRELVVEHGHDDTKVWTFR